MTDHDRLFKELLSTFFIEFLQLFVPDVVETIDPTSLRFLPQEYFADLTAGEDKVIDLLAEVKQSGEEVGFLVHVEAQSSTQSNFARRIFFYFISPAPEIFTADLPHRPILLRRTLSP